MISHSPTFIIFYLVGYAQGYTAASILLLSLAALIVRSRRRCLVASISTLSRILVATGAAVGFAYVWEAAIALFRGNPYERFAYIKHVTGPFAFWFWLMVFGSVLAPQLFWIKRCRTSACLSLSITIAILAPHPTELLYTYLNSSPATGNFPWISQSHH